MSKIYHFRFLDGKSNILKDTSGIEFIKEIDNEIIYALKLFDNTSKGDWKTITKKTLVKI